LKIEDCRWKQSQRKQRLLKFAVLSLQFAIGFCARAQGNSSLSESRIENAEQAETASTLLQQIEKLNQQLSIAQKSLRTLTSSLVESNAEAELFRRKYSDLQLRMEALGLASASKDRSKLEQRLLAAVSDLRLAEKEREEYRDQMLRLNEAMLRYLKTSHGGDAQMRMDLETQLRGANDVAARSIVTPAHEHGAEPSLIDGAVISVKEEWSFVVGNMGESHGIKIGMPLRAMHGDEKIATLRVVDVRDRICGAVIEDSGKERIEVGDRLQVDAKPNIGLK